MARGSKSKRRAQRDDFSVPSDFSQLLRPSYEYPSPSLSEVQDYRQWHPDAGDQPALTVFGRPARSKISRSTGRKTLPHTIAFRAPTQVVECVRRKSRREVLFAKKRTGKGSRKWRRHRTWRSDIHC